MCSLVSDCGLLIVLRFIVQQTELGNTHTGTHMHNTHRTLHTCFCILNSPTYLSMCQLSTYLLPKPKCHTSIHNVTGFKLVLSTCIHLLNLPLCDQPPITFAASSPVWTSPQHVSPPHCYPPPPNRAPKPLWKLPSHLST
jgi:hypothetical protein